MIASSITIGAIFFADLDSEHHVLVDGVACRGSTAAPVGDGPYPSVLVLHDWTGVGDFATRVVGAFERVVSAPRVDAARTAAIGCCFGGTAALLLARTGAAVAAVTSFHVILQPGLGGDAAAITAKV